MVVAGVLGPDIAPRDAGIVDEDRDWPVILGDLAGQGIDRGGFGDIKGLAMGVKTELHELGCGLDSTLTREVGDDHLGASLPQGLSARIADALRSASDDGHPAVKLISLQIHG